MPLLLPISIRRIALLCLLVLALGEMGQAQISNTVGKEFYFTYLPNTGFLEAYEMTVHITAAVTTSGTIEVIGSNYSQEFTVNAGSSLEIRVPDQFKILQEGVTQQAVVYVSTIEEVTVFAYNHIADHEDGTIVLPLPALDKEYLLHSRGEGTQFAVLATGNNTDIEITFSADSVRYQNTYYRIGEVLAVTLNRGELFYLDSKHDLSGTQVKVVEDGSVNCIKVAVFVGNTALALEDHRYNQLYAVRDWGKEYFALLFEDPFDKGDIYLMAGEDNTLVQVSGVPDRTMMRGETWVIQAKIEHYILSDKPLSIIHTGAGVMNVLSPLKQISNDVLFEIIHKDETQDHFVSVFTPTDRLNVRLNGEDISSNFETVQLATDYSFTVLPIDPGVHRLQASEGLVAFTYAVGDSTGAVYGLGGNLGNFEISLQNVNSDLPANQTCVGSDILLTAEAENEILTQLYTDFIWDMGDGNVVYGNDATYQYDTPGNYEITLFASKSPIACSDLTVTRNVEVMGAAIESIAGPEVLCPNVGSVEYELLGSESDYTYQWFAEGGTIDNSNGPMAYVSWNYGAAINELKAVSTSPLGCVSDTVRLDIRYLPELEPITPLGPSSVCGDFTGIAYYVPATNGSVYDWRVNGGTIVSGQGTADIVVNWDGPGEHSLFYFENSTTQTDYCEGNSLSLSVIVSQQIDFEVSTSDVTCFGQNDGTASVNISAGVAPLSVQWSTGSTQNSVSGLAGGRYELSITDGVGCVVTREVVIEEPTELTGYVEVQDPACVGSNGIATVVASGGTGNLSYNWGSNFTASDRNVGLGEGSFSVTVRDEAGCELILNYQVSIPQPFNVSFEKVRPCPDVAEGSLMLTVDGGTTPYQYAWVQQPDNGVELAEGLLAGDYQVTITDAQGCTLTLTESLENLSPMIQMPTAFSPNGDGDNDRFAAVYNCAVGFQMYIYNQWGNMVFGSTNIAKGWDGTYEGEPVPSGEYAYHIIYQAGPDGSYEESVKGRVRVVR